MKKTLLGLLSAAVWPVYAQTSPRLPPKITAYPVVADIDYAEGPASGSQGNCTS